MTKIFIYVIVVLINGMIAKTCVSLLLLGSLQQPGTAALLWLRPCFRHNTDYTLTITQPDDSLLSVNGVIKNKIRSL